MSIIKNECSLEAFSNYKKLEIDFLQQFGIKNITDHAGNNTVMIPYYQNTKFQKVDVPLFCKYRTSLEEDPKYCFDEGVVQRTGLIPYGMWRIENWLNLGTKGVIIGEGETDALSAWRYNYPYLGFSGAGSIPQSLEHPELLDLLSQFERIYVMIELDQGGQLVLKQLGMLRRSLQQKLLIATLPKAYKDLSALHIDVYKKGDLKLFSTVLNACLEQAVQYEIVPDELPDLFNQEKPPKLDPSKLPEHPFFSYVRAASESLQIPLELLLTQALPLLSTLFHKRFKVKIKNDWVAPINLWSLALAESGGGKSPGLRLLMAHFEDWEYRKCNAIKDINLANKKFNAYIEKQIQKCITDNLSESEEDGMQSKIQKLEDNKKPIYQELRLFARNITPEALICKLSQLNTPLTIVTDEAMGFFEIIAGRHSNKGGIHDADINSCWDGTNVHVDRITRENTIARNPLISMSLALQTSRFRAFKHRYAFLDSGHLCRYLVVLIETESGTRQFNSTPIPQTIQQQYFHFIEQVLNAEVKYDNNGNIAHHTLTLSDEALERYKEHWQNLENSIKSERNNQRYMQSYIPKMQEITIRLAANIHRAVTLENAAETSISCQTLETAIYLANFFIEHFRIAMEAMEVDIAQVKAQAVLEWMITHPKEQYTKSEIFNAKKDKSYVKTMKGFNELLKILLDQRCIFKITTAKGEAYRLNDYFWI